MRESWCFPFFFASFSVVALDCQQRGCRQFAHCKRLAALGLSKRIGAHPDYPFIRPSHRLPQIRIKISALLPIYDKLFTHPPTKYV